MSSAPAPARAARGQHSVRVVRLIVSLVGLVVVAWLMGNIFLAISYYPGWFFDNRS